MIYLDKGKTNVLVLNINNNARPDYSYYVLTFTHVMSKEVKSYTVYTNNPTQFWQNIRYCTVTLNLATDDLNYEGQYTLNIYGDGRDLIYIGMSVLEGTVEGEPFIEYISPNENNENYIYLT